MRINPGNFEFQRMGKHRKVVAKKADSSLVYAAHKCPGGVQKSAHDSPDQKHAKQNTKNFLISFTGHFDYRLNDSLYQVCTTFCFEGLSWSDDQNETRQDRQILFQEMKVPIIARFSASFEIYGNPILLSKLASTISFWFSNRHKIRFCFHSKQSCIIKTVLHSVKDHSLFPAHYGQVLRVSHGSKLWEMSVFLFHNSCSKRTSSLRYIYGLFLSQPTRLNADY